MKNKKLLFLIPFLFLSCFQIVNAQEESQVIEDNQIVQSIERILFVEVRGSQRIEPDTIRSYMTIKPGDLYNEEVVDQSLKILFNTGLFADVAIRYENSGLIVFVVENPIIQKITINGIKNKGILKELEKITRKTQLLIELILKEIKLLKLINLKKKLSLDPDLYIHVQKFKRMFKD